MASEITRPSTMACTPAMAASSGSFSPMRRATMAVVDSASPSPMANTSASSDSVRPTVATAFAPSRPTQNTSTTANRDSSTISSTMGMASRRMERLRLPVVKSWCEPRRASRTEDQRLGEAVCCSWLSAGVPTDRSSSVGCSAVGCGTMDSMADIKTPRGARRNTRARAMGFTLRSIWIVQCNHPGLSLPRVCRGARHGVNPEAIFSE